MIFKTEYFESIGLADIREKVARGERLSAEEGLRLFECPEPLAVGALANFARSRMHGQRAYFVVNRHVNYTNVCVNACTFCAYQREEEEQAGAFRLTTEDVLQKLAASPVVPREVHIVGGCHPKLPLSYFEEMLSAIRAAYPQTVLKCFTAVEIGHFAQLEGIDSGEVLERLQRAGLDMLPGGGAEIFAPRVREQVCPRKLTGAQWLDVHHKAHALGMKTNCTMLFGHIETREERLDHLIRLRELQDEHDGFVCFIPLPFLTENSALRIDQPLTGLEKLRTIAVSRLMLDNIPHIKAYWVMLGVKEAQAALKFGADDFDGTVVEEKIGHEAGASTSQGMTREGIREMIEGAGFTPVERDSYFNSVEALC